MNDHKIIELKKGKLYSYKKGDYELLLYSTNDPLNDQVVLFRNKRALISIEVPLFKENVRELNEYIRSLKLDNLYVLLSSHVSPKNYLSEAALYTSECALEALRHGGPKTLFEGFLKTFGGEIDKELRDDYHLIGDEISLDGLEMKIVRHNGDFNVEIPLFKAVYTHMLGHDVHSIVMGLEHADALINELEGFLSGGYELILTSHYQPETREDVETKIAYLKTLKSIATQEKTRDEFIKKVKERYPDYQGLNYLEMSASALFKE